VVVGICWTQITCFLNNKRLHETQTVCFGPWRHFVWNVCIPCEMSAFGIIFVAEGVGFCSLQVPSTSLFLFLVIWICGILTTFQVCLS
jgi:hypothetical protein